jgi:cytochrome c oxidase assembly protein subunit 15
VLWLIHRNFRQVASLNRLALLLGTLIVAQVLLGMATYVVKFAVPMFILSRWPDAAITVQAGGWWQTHIVTAHVAVGSALLGTSVALVLYSLRKLVSTAGAAHPSTNQLGVAT